MARPTRPQYSKEFYKYNNLLKGSNCPHCKKPLQDQLRAVRTERNIYSVSSVVRAEWGLETECSFQGTFGAVAPDSFFCERCNKEINLEQFFGGREPKPERPVF